MTTALIISTYNRPDTLALTLRSVAHQSKLPNEVIIADDGSTKTTKAVIDQFKISFPVPIYHVWQEDQGFRLSAIRNKAVSKSNSDYLIFTDGDIILHSKFIESHVTFAQANHFCQGHRVLLNADATKAALSKNRIDFDFMSQGITNRQYAIHMMSLAKLVSQEIDRDDKVKGCNFSCWKKDLLQVNGFNEAFIGWGKEDAEFIRRLLNNGIKGIDIKFAAVIYHLDHGENHKNETTELFSANQNALDKARNENLTWCEHGITKHN